MSGNLVEAPKHLSETTRPRVRLTRAMLAPVLASVTLVACSVGNGAKSSEQASALPTSVMPTSSASELKPAPQASKTPETPETTINTPAAEGLAGCLPYFKDSRYNNHEYEVCTAYVANSANVALRGLYKFGNNRIGYLADGARHHFETRYWEEARRTNEKLVASWPQTSSPLGNNTDAFVSVVNVSSNLAADRGLVKTRESWQVTAADGTVLYNEPLHSKEATMCRGRLPGHPLHEWVVVSPLLQPDFDCIAFDKAHNLEP